MKQLLFILLLFISHTVLGEVIVPMEKQENGLYVIPCKVNDVPMRFIFDTGASAVNISMAEALFLLKNGYIQESDIKGTSHAQIANGEIVENTNILLRKIDIGGIVIKDVEATVSHNLDAPLLLGQSAIKQLGTIQLDGANLIIKDYNGIDGQKVRFFNLLHFCLAILVIIVVGFLFYIYKLKESKYVLGTECTSSNKNVYLLLNSKITWLKNRRYVIYIFYCFLLLLYALVIEVHISNKREKLYSELEGNVRITFGEIHQSIDALDFDRIDDLEYEEVSIPTFIPPYESDGEEWCKRANKRARKQWNNKFSGIEHVYKITDQGWRMAGMQYADIPDIDRHCEAGIQDYFFSPYMICVPDGLDFNTEIAKIIIEKSLDKVYCKPDQYNNAAKIKLTQNEYFHFVGNTFLQDSLPKLCMRFYNEVTGTDPIYNNNKFTGYYWFGMHKIGQYRVIYAYTNSIAWRIEEKEGFNASIKDRVIYYSITFILLTILLVLLLYSVNTFTQFSRKII